MPLEIERKFLIKTPLTIQNMRLVWLDAISVDHIYQFYLHSEKGVTRRLRSIRPYSSPPKMKSYKYIYTVKTNIAPGINEEDEKEVSLDEYEELAHRSNVDNSKAAIYKTRYTFEYENQVFELDVFEKELEGLALLEIELDSMEDKVILPPFLNVVKEVTEDKRYRNSRIAKMVREYSYRIGEELWQKDF